MQYNLIITNNDLIVEIEKNKQIKITSTKINVNDFLNNLSLENKMILTRFQDVYIYITDELLQTPKVACDIALKSKMTFDRRIPLNFINNFYDLDMSSDTEDIKRAITKYNNEEKKHIYYCADQKDLCVAILYHFLNNGYYFKICQKCGSAYLRNDKRSLYCDKCKILKEEERTTTKNVEQKERAKLPYNIIINKIRQRYYNAINKEIDNKIITMYENDLLKFNELVHKNRLRLKHGDISENDFLELLADLDNKTSIILKKGGASQ